MTMQQKVILDFPHLWLLRTFESLQQGNLWCGSSGKLSWCVLSLLHDTNCAFVSQCKLDTSTLAMCRRLKNHF